MRLLPILRTACVIGLITLGLSPAYTSPAVTAGLRSSSISFEQDRLDFDQRVLVPNLRFAWTFPPVWTDGSGDHDEFSVSPLASLSAGVAGQGRYRQGNAGWQVLPRDGVPVGGDVTSFAGVALEWQRDPAGAMVAAGPALAARGYLYTAGSLSPAASYLAGGGLVRGEVWASAGGSLKPVIGIAAGGMPFGVIRGSLRNVTSAWHWGLDAGVRF